MDEPQETGLAATRFPMVVYESTTGASAMTLTFDDYGKYTLTRDGEFAVRGSYRVTGGEIEFTDERGPRAGIGDKKVGRYGWKMDDEILSLTLIEDRSGGRISACSRPWTRQD